jgi:cytochrome c
LIINNRKEKTMKSLIVSMIATAGLIVAGSAAAETEMPAIVKEGGFACAGCHLVDSKKVGPSWRDVSKFYNGKMDKTATDKTLKDVLGGKDAEGFLIEKISKGGKGNWGAMPMSPVDPGGAKQEQIRQIAQWILNLEK